MPAPPKTLSGCVRTLGIAGIEWRYPQLSVARVSPARDFVRKIGQCYNAPQAGPLNEVGLSGYSKYRFSL